jgi:hypothetical protein
MKRRNSSVGHSDHEARDVRLLPPGAASRGIAPSPADGSFWQFIVRLVDLEVDSDELESMLRRPQAVLETRVSESFQRLIDHCQGKPWPTVEISLDDF